MKFKTLGILFTLLLVVGLVGSSFAGVTEMKIYSDEMMDADSSQLNPVTGVITRYGSKSNPATYYIIRWCVNRENEHNFMDINSDAAAGPYGMHFGMGDIPSNNLWMDLRRTDAAPGWDYPLDASSTQRVTFWIKADPGTAPLWFMGQSYKPSSPPVVDATLNERQYSVNAFIDGETIIQVDDFGDLYTLRDNPWNGEWQFVSLPWDFLTDADSAEVSQLLPWSLAWEGSVKDKEGNKSSFDISRLRTIKWHTKPESDFLIDQYWNSPNNLWGPPGQKAKPGVWAIDEVTFCLNQGTGITNADGEETTVPLTYELKDAYPNPFNPSTTIEYGIPVSNKVSLIIYNEMGQRIRTLVDENRTTGTYKVVWDGKDDFGNAVSSGVYFCKMQSSHFTATKKLLLQK